MLPEPKPITQVMQKPKETVEAKPTSPNVPDRDSTTVSHDENTAPQDPLDTMPQTIEPSPTELTQSRQREKPPMIPRALRALQPYNNLGRKEKEPLPKRRPRY